MTKENNSNINKLNVNLRQTKSAQQTNILGLSAAEIGFEIADLHRTEAQRLRKEALDQPRKEAERARERAIKQFEDQITGRGIIANHLADRESELKRQIETTVKQLLGNSPRDIELKHSLYKKLSVAQAFGVFADANKSLFEISKTFRTEYSEDLKKLSSDFNRAKRLLAFADEFDEIDITEGLTTLENELQANGALTSRQLFYLIIETQGVDTSSMGKVLGKNGGEGKKGHKCELYYAVKKVTELIESNKYIDVARYLNKQTNQTIMDITVISSNLPYTTNEAGIMEYQTSKGKVKPITSSGIAAHIRNIKKVKNI